MNDLTIFENAQFGQVRTINRGGEPWFIAADVCAALEISNSRDAITRLDDDEKGVASTDTLGGKQNMAIVNESGLYTLVLGSRKPEAKQFKRWITHEVIPAIRKHGAYLTPQKIEEVLLNPDTIISLATQLKAERAQRMALESKVEADKPRVLFAAAVETAKTSILVGEFAKILKQNGVNMGQNRFFEWLRENGYLIKRKGTDWNMPTQRSMEAGLFEIKETAIAHADGHTSISKTTKITGKGQTYFAGIFLGADRQAG